LCVVYNEFRAILDLFRFIKAKKYVIRKTVSYVQCDHN